MKNIVFFDFDFVRLGEFSKFISVNYEKKYRGFGSVELHFPVTEYAVVEVLENNQYMFFTVDGHSAIVTGWRVGDDIAIFARTPEWILTKRAVGAFSESGVDAVELVVNIVAENCQDMVLIKTVEIQSATVDFSIDTVTTVYDIVCDILKIPNLGFEITADLSRKQFVFNIISGSERPGLISKSNKTAFDVEYTVDMQDAVTKSGWFERRYENMGDWDADKNRPILKNRDPENYFTFYRITTSHENRLGLNCVEGEYLYCDTVDGLLKTTPDMPSTQWVYMDNPDVYGLKKWDAVLSGVKVGTQGENEIKTMTVNNSISAEVKNVEFGLDYNIGDVVLVQMEFGKFRKTEKKRVTAVSFYYDTDKSGVVPVLSGLEE